MDPADDPAKPSNELKPGDWVEIEGFLRVGRIKSLDGRRRAAEVEVAGIIWNVSVARLKASPTARDRGERIASENEPPTFSIPVLGGSDVIDLHGLRVEEGIEELDKFVDTAVVNQFETIKIIHGHGSGKLRHAVRKYLIAHPAVIHFQFGAPWEGGMAVTIARLGRRDR